jgi:type III secretory pathway component EscT
MMNLCICIFLFLLFLTESLLKGCARRGIATSAMCAVVCVFQAAMVQCGFDTSVCFMDGLQAPEIVAQGDFRRCRYSLSE